MPQVVIVVPCYNEASRLPVARFARFINESAVSFVFVDDGSTDATLKVLNRLREGKEGRVFVLSMNVNRGKAEAVRCGMLYGMEQAAADYVGYWDADLATPLSAIQDLSAILENQPEIQMVFGSRVKLLGRRVERQPVRHYLGRVFATVVSIMLQIPVYDTQCGAKLFRVHPGLNGLFAEPFLSRWVFDVEIIARYINQVESPLAGARRIYEYPLHVWEDVSGSKVKAVDFVKAFMDVARIHWKYRLHTHRKELVGAAG